MADAAAVGDGFRHLALFYRDRADYLTALQHFALHAASGAQPVLLAVPEQTLSWLRPELGRESEHVRFANMTELGRNPARIIPSVRSFADQYPRQRVWYIAEPAWPRRSAAELREVTRHEALSNAALAGLDVTMLCPYDIARLSGQVIADAACTHAAIASDGSTAVSASYLEPPGMPPGCRSPLPPPPGYADCLEYERDLRPLRAMISSGALRAGMPAGRTTDLVLAVSEVGANTLRHTRAGGIAYLWHTDEEVICQVHDTGIIADPLAGRWVPAGDLPGGKGLWLVNQVCDLVELRTGDAAGTTVRLHMRLS